MALNERYSWKLLLNARYPHRLLRNEKKIFSALPAKRKIFPLQAAAWKIFLACGAKRKKLPEAAAKRKIYSVFLAKRKRFPALANKRKIFAQKAVAQKNNFRHVVLNEEFWMQLRSDIQKTKVKTANINRWLLLFSPLQVLTLQILRRLHIHTHEERNKKRFPFFVKQNFFITYQSVKNVKR